MSISATPTVMTPPNDWKITGPLTVELRRERDPHGNGRVYTVHVEAIDAAGNRAVATVTATVPHDSGNNAPTTVNPVPTRRRRS